jgi:hypothetical protein
MMDTATTTTPNWDQIKVDFEEGILPIREIARREGISDTSIHKKARSNGWHASLRKRAGPANPMLPGLQTEVQTDRAEVERPIERSGNTVQASINPDDDGFEWRPENEDVLVPESRALALYIIRWGQIVLRQDGGYDGDVYIQINIHDVPHLIERLRGTGEGGLGGLVQRVTRARRAPRRHHHPLALVEDGDRDGRRFPGASLGPPFRDRPAEACPQTRHSTGDPAPAKVHHWFMWVGGSAQITQLNAPPQFHGLSWATSEG